MWRNTFAYGNRLLLDFDSEDDFTQALENGQAISTPGEFGRLVSVTAQGANLGATVFDSTPGGPNGDSVDGDMLVGKGNILMLQDSGHPAESRLGFFDVPLDDPDGGDLVFAFTHAVTPLGVVLIDLDPPPNQGASVTLSDQSGATRVYSVPPGWTGTFGSVSGRKLDLTTLAPQVGNAPGFKLATASEQSGFVPERVERIVVHLTGAGALDDLEFEQ